MLTQNAPIPEIALLAHSPDQPRVGVVGTASIPAPENYQLQVPGVYFEDEWGVQQWERWQNGAPLEAPVHEGGITAAALSMPVDFSMDYQEETSDGDSQSSQW